jgi:poly(hydroxyalkanoate) depolymerase family esterase
MTRIQKISSSRSGAATLLLVALLSFSLQSFASRNANAGALNPFLQLPSLSGLGSGTAQLPSLPGKWAQGNYKNQFGSRDYYLYVPQNGQAGPLPLVVALHGCEEDAVTFATQTGLGEIGEKYGFAVLFPQEAQQDNMFECWNWFKPENQARDSGELSIVVGMIGQVNGQIQIDKNRIFVGGISAGGAMAANLLACYSDLFAGGLIHSGLEFEASTSDANAFQAMSSGSSTDPVSSASDAIRCTGSTAKLETVLIIHGSQDTTVNPINSTLALRQFTQMNDLLDDGSANGSQTTTPIDTSHLTAPGGDTYDMDSYGGTGGTHIVNVTVNGMAHAWSGAHQSGQFADPKGPDAGEMMWQFLSKNCHRP